VFVVDISRYIPREERSSIKKFLKSLVKRMSFKNRFKVGIVTYGKRADVKLTLRQSIKKRNVLNAVSSIR
jgi:hypothetical protein